VTFASPATTICELVKFTTRRQEEFLESHCPDLVPVDRWQKCVEDGRRFLAQWGGHAEASGWTARDLFGLALVHSYPTFRNLCSERRLSGRGLSRNVCGQLVHDTSPT
jgi:hypothetical protein